MLGALALPLIVAAPAAIRYLPITYALRVVGAVAAWALVAAAVVGAIAVLYRYGPDRSSSSRWITPGAVAAGVLWLAGSWLFSIYVASFGKYDETYGTIGGVIILLMWLYISAYVVLLGAEIESEAERETGREAERRELRRRVRVT